MRSPLRVVEDAVDRGVLWVNAAGNSALRTQFLRGGVTFPEDGAVLSCLPVNTSAGADYWLQARWADSFPDLDEDVAGASIDLDIELFSSTSGERLLAVAEEQSGGSDHYPLEVMRYRSAGGRLCVGLSKKTGDANPAWVQLNVIGPLRHDFINFSGAGASVLNPAEFYDLRVLAVGAGSYEPATLTSEAGVSLWDQSARGPLPAYFGLPRHVKPDVVGVPARGTTTSLASAHVAGVSALLLQAYGLDRTGMRLAGDVRSHAVQYGIGLANDDWGHRCRVPAQFGSSGDSGGDPRALRGHAQPAGMV